VAAASSQVDAASGSRDVDASNGTARGVDWLRDRQPLLAIGLTLLALLPVLVTVLTRSGSSYVPVGDMGMIDLRVRDVWSANFPLIGPYSRYGWSHPGPLLFWILAIPSRLFGQDAWVTLVGGAMLQGVATIWLAALAWRRGALPLVSIALVGMTFLYVSTGSWIMLEPWNPNIALPFFALFVFQAWLLATGEARVLPGAALVATFLVQTHVGYASLVAVATVVVVVFAVLDARGHKEGLGWSSWRRPVWISLAIVLVLWLPVVVEQVTSSYGNLARLGDYFTGGSAEPVVGFTSGLQLMAAEFRVPPPWLGGANDADPFTGAASEGSPLLLLLPLVLLGVGLYATRRPAAVASRRFVLLAGALVITGIVTLARVTGVPYLYLFLWRSAVAVVLVLTVAWAAANAARLSRWRNAAVSGVVAAFIVVALGSGGLAWSIVDHPSDVSEFERATEEIASQLERHGVPPDGVILRLETISPIALQRGVFNELDRAGVSVSVDESLDNQFGNRRGAKPEDVEEVWWVVENGRSLAYLASLPGAEVIARSTPLGPDEEQEAEVLERRILDGLVAASREDLAGKIDGPFVALALGGVPGIDQRDVERIGELNAKVVDKDGCRCGVVAMRPNVALEDVAWLS
jgi:hypothetical protein